MDYQYKSLLRGEHSIFERIKSQGVDPTSTTISMLMNTSWPRIEHIFVFNLRSYDRLNTTPAIKAQEEKSGLKYKDIQNAEAEEIMGSSTHHTGGQGDGKVKQHLKRESSSSASASNAPTDDSGDLYKEHAVDQKRRFEDQKDAVGLGGDERTEGQEMVTASTVAQGAMLNTRNVSEEHWPDGHEDLEKENFVQEELYIHAKVMIVDDRFAICGSSNINDRSQLGVHDSELSLVVEDTKILETTMDGKPYQAGYVPATLRRRLWREHLGLLPPQDLDGSNDPNAQPPGDSPNDNGEGDEFDFVADPLSDKVWNMWTSNATLNTDIFRDLFHADPDNSSEDISIPGWTNADYDVVKTFEQYHDFTPNPKQDEEHKQGHIYDRSMSITELKKELDRIKGHLVWMPLDFLCEAEMAEKGLQVNSITESVYT